MVLQDKRQRVYFTCTSWWQRLPKHSCKYSPPRHYCRCVQSHKCWHSPVCLLPNQYERETLPGCWIYKWWCLLWLVEHFNHDGGRTVSTSVVKLRGDCLYETRKQPLVLRGWCHCSLLFNCYVFSELCVRVLHLLHLTSYAFTKNFKICVSKVTVQIPFNFLT